MLPYMGGIARRPRVTAAALSLALLVVIKQSAVLAHDVRTTWWATLVVIVSIVYTVGVTWYFQRRPPPAESAKVAELFLALAVAPTTTAAGALWVGASPWSAWAALAASLGLIAWWAWTRDKNRWELPPTRFDRWVERHRKPLYALGIIGIVWTAASFVRFAVTHGLDPLLGGAATAFGTFGLILLVTREASRHVQHWDAAQLNGSP